MIAADYIGNQEKKKKKKNFRSMDPIVIKQQNTYQKKKNNNNKIGTDIANRESVNACCFVWTSGRWRKQWVYSKFQNRVI